VRAHTPAAIIAFILNVLIVVYLARRLRGQSGWSTLLPRV